MREHNRVISQHDFPLSGLFFFLVELVGPRLFLDFYHNLKSLFFLFKGVFVQDVGLLNERVLNQTGSMWKATLKCLCECLKNKIQTVWENVQHKLTTQATDASNRSAITKDNSLINFTFNCETNTDDARALVHWKNKWPSCRMYIWIHLSLLSIVFHVLDFSV